MPTFNNTIRSITLPVRSHPTTQRVEEELNNLKSNFETNFYSSSSKATTICKTLLGLRDLHKRVEELLGLPLTRQALDQHQQEKWFQETLDESIKHLDFCGNLRDAILAGKERVVGLQSAIRRKRIGDYKHSNSMFESDFVAYLCFRKAMKKKIGNYYNYCSSKQANKIEDLNVHLCAVLRVLRETSSITSSIFRSISRFLSTNVLKAKPRKWSLISMMVNKGVLGSSCEDINMNEFESVDIALGELVVVHNNNSICDQLRVEDEKVVSLIECALRKLEDLEGVLDGLENGLEGLFRLLINNRVCLLNVISQ